MENTLFVLQAGVTDKDWLILCRNVVAVTCYCVISRLLCPCSTVYFIFILINLTLHFDLSVISSPGTKEPVMKKAAPFHKMYTWVSTLALLSSLHALCCSLALIPSFCSLYMSVLLQSLPFRLQTES